jgi:hypothetical protein
LSAYIPEDGNFLGRLNAPLCVVFGVFASVEDQNFGEPDAMIYFVAITIARLVVVQSSTAPPEIQARHPTEKDDAESDSDAQPNVRYCVRIFRYR